MVRLSSFAATLPPGRFASMPRIHPVHTERAYSQMIMAGEALATAHTFWTGRPTLQSIARIRSAAAIIVHAHTVRAKGVALFPTESGSRIHGNAPCRFVKWVKQIVAAILGQVGNVRYDRKCKEQMPPRVPKTARNCACSNRSNQNECRSKQVSCKKQVQQYETQRRL